MDRALPNLPSRDPATILDFYAGFGFVERYRDEAWMILSRGTLTLEFFHHPELEPKASHFQCTVRVADLDELWEAVHAAGPCLQPRPAEAAPSAHRGVGSAHRLPGRSRRNPADPHRGARSMRTSQATHSTALWSDLSRPSRIGQSRLV